MFEENENRIGSWNARAENESTHPDRRRNFVNSKILNSGDPKTPWVGSKSGQPECDNLHYDINMW